MAFINCHFFSDVLGISTSVNVLLPEKTSRQIGLKGQKETGKHKTLWLLHGLSDDQSIWCRRTSIERYATKYSMAVIMPNVHRSFYVNMEHGYNYWDFLSEELPTKMRDFFPLSDKQEDNYVAGLSMGGYGAFKWAFRQPEKFAGTASLSGVMNVERRVKEFPEHFPDIQNVFGDFSHFKRSPNDLFHLIKTLKDSGKKIPKIYQCCGTEDTLYLNNIEFRDFVATLGIKTTYEEGPGDHEWGYWDSQIQKVFRWIKKVEIK
jgi:S-formylglutathione hydrolase FrmB